MTRNIASTTAVGGGTLASEYFITRVLIQIAEEFTTEMRNENIQISIDIFMNLLKVSEISKKSASKDKLQENSTNWNRA